MPRSPEGCGKLVRDEEDMQEERLTETRDIMLYNKQSWARQDGRSDAIVDIWNPM